MKYSRSYHRKQPTVLIHFYEWKLHAAVFRFKCCSWKEITSRFAVIIFFSPWKSGAAVNLRMACDVYWDAVRPVLAYLRVLNFIREKISNTKQTIRGFHPWSNCVSLIFKTRESESPICSHKYPQNIDKLIRSARNGRFSRLENRNENSQQFRSHVNK